MTCDCSSICADVLVEGVCSSDGHLLRAFNECGNSSQVQVNVSISFETVGYSTFTLSCYNDDDGAGTWVIVDEW